MAGLVILVPVIHRHAHKGPGVPPREMARGRVLWRREVRRTGAPPALLHIVWGRGAPPMRVTPPNAIRGSAAPKEPATVLIAFAAVAPSSR